MTCHLKTNDIFAFQCRARRLKRFKGRWKDILGYGISHSILIGYRQNRAAMNTMSDGITVKTKWPYDLIFRLRCLSLDKRSGPGPNPGWVNLHEDTDRISSNMAILYRCCCSLRYITKPKAIVASGSSSAGPPICTHTILCYIFCNGMNW